MTAFIVFLLILVIAWYADDWLAEKTFGHDTCSCHEFERTLKRIRGAKTDPPRRAP